MARDVEIELSPCELDAMKRRAAQEGISVGEYVRRRLLRRANDFQGGGLSPAEAKRQRKQLTKEIAADQKKKDLAKLAELRQAIRTAKQGGKVRRKDAVEACRLGRQLAKDRAKVLRAEGRAAINAAIAQEKIAARQTCEQTKQAARGETADAVVRAKRELAAERAFQREIRRIESRSKKKERTTAAERRAESDDEVRANIPPDMVPLFERVKRSIKGSDRESRTEAFLRYAEENSGELIEAMQADADRELRKLQREAVLEERRLRKAGYRSADFDEAVPF